MKAVTKENLTKISETTLVNILNTLDNTCPTAVMIEHELDRRADIIDQAKVRLEMRRESDAKKLAELKSEVSAMFVNLKQGRMARLIEMFGDDFAKDYSYDSETFIIVSHVAHKGPDFKTDNWEHETEHDAMVHLKTLIYDRIYDRHMRNATIDSLSVLKLLLEELK